MKKDTILDLVEMLESELKTTYKEIENGKPYKMYMEQSLKAFYEFVEYFNELGVIHFDLEGIKERDKEKYSLMFEGKEV